MSYPQVERYIEGNWNKMSDAKVAKLNEWLDRHKVREDDVLAALESLIEDGVEFSPKTAQIAKKLKDMGAILPPPLGVGDRGVVGRMKFDINDGIQDTIAILPQWTYGGRLRSEYEQAQIYATEDREYDLGSADYWRDRLQAFRELIEQEGAA